MISNILNTWNSKETSPNIVPVNQKMNHGNNHSVLWIFFNSIIIYYIMINMLFYKNKMSIPPNEWDTMILGMGCLGYKLSCYRCEMHYWVQKDLSKKQIIQHITIESTDFHYKAMNHYHQLVSLLFSLHDYMSLDQNDDWCPFAYRYRVQAAPNTLKFLTLITEFLDTEIVPAIKPTSKNNN